MTSSALGTGLDPQISLALGLSADTLKYYQISNLVVVLTYGIYLPLFLKSFLLVWPRVRSSNPSRWLFVLLVILFTTTTIHLASGLSVNFTLLAWPKAGSPDSSIAYKLRAAADIGQAATAAFFYSGRINIALIDTIVVWRAYVLQARNLPIRLLLVILYGITILYSTIMIVITPDPAYFGISDTLCNALNIFRDTLALSLNIAATVCIAWTAWFFSHHLNAGSGIGESSFVNRVFQVMLEGGIILALIQIVTIILGLFTTNSESDSQTITSAGSIGFMIISEILIAAAAIYPSLVTNLVANQRSTLITDGPPKADFKTDVKTDFSTLRSTKKRPPSLAISVASSIYVHSDYSKDEAIV